MSFTVTIKGQKVTGIWAYLLFFTIFGSAFFCVAVGITIVTKLMEMFLIPGITFVKVCLWFAAIWSCITINCEM